MALFAFHSVSRSFVEYTKHINSSSSSTECPNMWLAASNWPCHRELLSVDANPQRTSEVTLFSAHIYIASFIAPKPTVDQPLYSPTIQVAEEGHYEITNALNGSLSNQVGWLDQFSHTETVRLAELRTFGYTAHNVNEFTFGSITPHISLRFITHNPQYNTFLSSESVTLFPVALRIFWYATIRT